MPPSDDDLLPPPIERARLVLWALAGEGGILAFAYVAALLAGVPFWEHLQFSASGFAWGLAASLPMIAAAAIMIELPWRALEPIRRNFEMICELFRASTVPDLLLISLMAGLGEEVLFRGVLQVYAAELTTPWIGVAAASIIFGALHALSAIYFAFATVLGVYLGSLYLWTGDLLIVIVAHAAYDAVALVYGVRAPSSSREN